MKQTNTERKELRWERQFNANFKTLALFVGAFNRYPKKEERPKLYSWMKYMVALHKANKLAQKYVRQLDTIGFIWSVKEYKWFTNADLLKKLVLTKKALPSKHEDAILFNWLSTNQRLINKNALPKDKRVKMDEIFELIKKINKSLYNKPIVALPAKDRNWAKMMDKLIAFREKNPTIWPRIEKVDENEKKLGIWCQYIRLKFKEGKLEKEWIKKLQQINFLFVGKVDFWKNKFEKLKQYLEKKKQMPPADSLLFKWAKLQFYTIKKLNKERQKMILSIHLHQYFQRKTWDDSFVALKKFIAVHKTIPTTTSNPVLYGWLNRQKEKYRNKRLDESRVMMLKKIGVDLSYDKHKTTWNLHYATLKKFRAKNPNRWPARNINKEERKLFLWCLIQRQVKARTALNRKELAKERVEKLNKIGFRWALDEKRDQKWLMMNKKLKKFISTHQNASLIPASINGKPNDLYRWFWYQKKAFQAGKLRLDRKDKLMALGVLPKQKN